MNVREQNQQAALSESGEFLPSPSDFNPRSSRPAHVFPGEIAMSLVLLAALALNGPAADPLPGAKRV